MVAQTSLVGFLPHLKKNTSKLSLFVIEAIKNITGAYTEVTAPARRRVFGLSITARDNRDRGQPSAWSAVIDSLAADVDRYGANPRLLVVAAGNVVDNNA